MRQSIIFGLGDACEVYSTLGDVLCEVDGVVREVCAPFVAYVIVYRVDRAMGGQVSRVSI